MKNLSSCTVFSSLTARVESDGALNSLTTSSEQWVRKIMEWNFTRSYNARKMLVSFLLRPVLLRQSDRQTPQSTVLHTDTHSPLEEDQPHPWKEAVRSFIISVLLTLPSKHIQKANQVLGVIFNCTTTQIQTHTRQHRWVAQNFMCCFLCLFLFVSATLGAVTLIPALQVAAQEAGLRNAGPCACLRSLSLVMRVWLTQLVCLSANWVGLREKKQSDIRGKC